MDTRHLRVFLKIADTGSISRAAESLCIAQPSLSQQLLRLEDEVGAKLFRRTARGVTLTEAGRVFQEHARALIGSADQAIEDVRMLKGEASGPVLMAVPWSISRLAGFQLVEAFRRHAPHVSLRLVEAMTGQIRGWLEEGKVDLGILHDLGALRHLSSRRLAREELFLIGPPGAFGTSATDPARVAPDALSALPMILPGAPHGLRQTVEQDGARLGFSLDVRIELDAFQHVGRLVEAGHGFSIMPLPAVAEDLAAGRVSIARIGARGVRRTLCLMRNTGRVVTHASVRAEDLTAGVLARMIDKGEWLAEAEPGLR